jgi:hypothetical protein
LWHAMTVGIPNPRCPPPAFGIYLRRITPGRYVPSSRSACSLGSTTGHCSSSCSIVCPSGPGAPLFDATFNNALVKRLATSSIVAGAAVPVVPIAFGAPARMAPSRSRVFLRVAPFGFSAVAIGRLSCTAVSSTGIAFPCPPGLDPARSAAITAAFRYYSILGLLLGHEPSSSSSSGLPTNPAGTQQISLGETPRFRRDRVATTPPGSNNRSRASPLEDGSPLRGTPYGASLSFATTTHLRPPSDPPSRKPRSAKPGRTGTARSIPGRALAFDVGFPLSSSRTGLTPPISTSVPGTPPLAPRGSLRCEPARSLKPSSATASVGSVRAVTYSHHVN